MRKQKPLIEDVLFPFPDVEFAQKWQEWLDDRKARRIKPYTARGVKGAFRNLFELSGGDVQIAIKILDQSMDQGWQGLFHLRINPINNGATYKRTFEEKPTPSGNVASGGFGKL